MRRHWFLPVTFALAFSWWIAEVNLNPVMSRLHGDRAASLSIVYILAASVGLITGGLLWTRKAAYQAARPVLAAVLAAAGILTALLPFVAPGAWTVMHGAMGLLVGLWYPAFGSALYARVGADERGRVIGWMLALGYAPGYVLAALTPLVSPALLTTGVALCLVLAGAIPLHLGQSPTPAVEGRAVLRPWRRLFIFALIAGPVVGIVRVDVHALLSAPANVHVAQLAAQVAAALLAGTLIDLRGRTRAAGAGVMTLGLSMGLGLLRPGGTAQLLMLLGTGIGVLMLEAFWATVLADLSPGYGPAISFGFGHALALLAVGGGAWIGRLLPPVETAGLAILALFVATGLLWGVPETRSAGAARKHPPPPPPAPDMASALQLTARQPLTKREMEVALLLIKGVSTAQMAEQLFLTMHTIRAHLHRIYSKTETASRHELLARVIAHVSGNEAPQP